MFGRGRRAGGDRMRIDRDAARFDPTQPPTAKMTPQTSIGPGEGQLNLVLWDGYADKSWVDPFTATTGCKVTQKPAGSSDEMVSLMKDGGGG